MSRPEGNRQQTPRRFRAEGQAETPYFNMEVCSFYCFSNGWCIGKDGIRCMKKDTGVLPPEEMMLHRPDTQWLQTLLQRSCRDGCWRLLKVSLQPPLPWSTAALQIAKIPFVSLCFSPLPSCFSASTSLQRHELSECGQIRWPDMFLHRAQTQDSLKIVADIQSQI